VSEANKKGIHHLGKIGRTYERILELPVAVVLKILWLAGAASIGVVVAALYLYWLALWAAAGA
jgi:hypothetical protein